jgi:hypothetical protein
MLQDPLGAAASSATPSGAHVEHEETHWPLEFTTVVLKGQKSVPTLHPAQLVTH